MISNFLETQQQNYWLSLMILSFDVRIFSMTFTYTHCQSRRRCVSNLGCKYFEINSRPVFHPMILQRGQKCIISLESVPINGYVYRQWMCWSLLVVRGQTTGSRTIVGQMVGQLAKHSSISCVTVRRQPQQTVNNENVGTALGITVARTIARSARCTTDPSLSRQRQFLIGPFLQLIIIKQIEN